MLSRSLKTVRTSCFSVSISLNHRFSSAIPSLAPSNNYIEKAREKEKGKEEYFKAHWVTLNENTTLYCLRKVTLQLYNRKRLAMSFENQNLQLKELRATQVLNKTRNGIIRKQWNCYFPPKWPKINWTQAAKSVNIQAGNPGQELTKFAVDKWLDTVALDQRTFEPPPRVRALHQKLPGGEMSTAALPTVDLYPLARLGTAAWRCSVDC